ncbi:MULTISPECIES: hypothetical protein [unclassified Streptomyces]|uniref:hypothetical protein n=1 Tax=unclassified Streptomyces TaxID=2593676 RepID=UPI0038043C82
MGTTAAVAAPELPVPARAAVPLPLSDDSTVQVSLPFTFRICGQAYTSVWVNSNGNLTFGSGDTNFVESTPQFLNGQPRIAGLWDDLNPEAGGTVSYTSTQNEFTVAFENVPEFFNSGSNTFSMTLRRSSNQIDLKYGGLTAQDGIAGVSCGGAITTGTETERNLRTEPDQVTHNMRGLTAFFEQFTGPASDSVDLANYRVRFTNQ